MPDWIVVIILGVIEGITEFLPISSTGHLLIAERWLPRQSDLFNIVIQCGAVIAVLPLFPARCRQLIYGWRDDYSRDFMLKMMAAFVLTGAVGFVLDKMRYKLPEKLLPVALAMLVGGILFVWVERWLRGRQLVSEITWTMALLVGVGQLVAAVFPGTSRSGASILVMLAMGLSRPLATEFSFLVGVPTMLAAGGWKIFKALHHPVPGVVPENWALLGLCTVVSAVVSFIAVKWLLRFVQTHTFTGFGWYRIAFGLLLLLLWS
jgi:undecaprenyl-diphosphatase